MLPPAELEKESVPLFPARPIALIEKGLFEMSCELTFSTLTVPLLPIPVSAMVRILKVASAPLMKRRTLSVRTSSVPCTFRLSLSKVAKPSLNVAELESV